MISVNAGICMHPITDSRTESLKTKAYVKVKKNYYIPTRKGFAKKIPIRQFTVLRVLTAFVNLSGMRMEDTEKVQNEEIVYPGSMYQ